MQEAAEVYTGNQTEEAIVNAVLVPLAAEYNITATFDEFKAYMESLNRDDEMSKDELQQVASGKTGGLGIEGCYVIGRGGGDGSGGVCLIIGVGWGYYNCTGSDTTEY